VLNADLRPELTACRHAARAIASPEVRALADELLDHVLSLHEAGHLSGAFLQLALQSLGDIHELRAHVQPLMALAQSAARAEGHRDFTGTTGEPYIASRFGSL
jgi:hypothetical protein